MLLVVLSLLCLWLPTIVYAHWIDGVWIWDKADVFAAATFYSFLKPPLLNSIVLSVGYGMVAAALGETGSIILSILVVVGYSLMLFMVVANLVIWVIGLSLSIFLIAVIIAIVGALISAMS